MTLYGGSVHNVTVLNLSKKERRKVRQQSIEAGAFSDPRDRRPVKVRRREAAMKYDAFLAKLRRESKQRIILA